LETYTVIRGWVWSGKCSMTDDELWCKSHDTKQVCEKLGIEKKEIKKGRPYQNYIEAAFGVQRRMADWSFERAQTWEDLLAAHDKGMLAEFVR
jgi:hypothetical protein